MQQSTESKRAFPKKVTSISRTPISNPASTIIQHSRVNQKSLTPEDVLQLQHTIGNRVVGRLFSGIRSLYTIQPATVQRWEMSEEEELLQKKTENNTGMPDNLKAGVENLSGIDMSDARVHYNSPKPAEVGALAFTQGIDIHVAPGQDRHLPHEAWHVVQQAQGRVKPTFQMKGMLVNDDVGLESEANVMGEYTNSSVGNDFAQITRKYTLHKHILVVQREVIKNERGKYISTLDKQNPKREFDSPQEAEEFDSLLKQQQKRKLKQDEEGEKPKTKKSEKEKTDSPMDADQDELADTLDSEQRQAELIIRLPPLQIDASLVQEAQRQLDLQLRGLRTLTARQWLVNLILNRMKTTEQQIGQQYGTEEGRRLAEKIDKELKRNRQLALLVMDAVLERMQAVSFLVQGDPIAEKWVLNIIQAAAKAKDQEEVYMAFRYFKGLDGLAVLNEAGLIGGIGRQHGPGDEKWFRKQFNEGIELAMQMDPTVAKNACLHNPDQCAGGPLEILWRMGQVEKLQRLKTFYNKQLKQFQRARYLYESYQASPPLRKDRSVDEERIEMQAEEYTVALDGVEQAASLYIHAILENLGNYDVNSLLGMSWMTRVEGIDQINRVDAILDQVLKIPFEDLGSFHLRVDMQVDATPFSTVPAFGSCQFPDFTNPSYIPPAASMELGKRSGHPAAKSGERIDMTLKSRCKQQQTLEDLSYQPERRQQMPSFDIPSWQHGFHQLPDWIIARGVLPGQTILINGERYVVLEDKSRSVSPSDDNPMGRAMYVRFLLRGG